MPYCILEKISSGTLLYLGSLWPWLISPGFIWYGEWVGNGGLGFLALLVWSSSIFATGKINFKQLTLKCSFSPGCWFSIKCSLISTGTPIVEIRQSYHLHISTMGFHITIECHCNAIHYNVVLYILLQWLVQNLITRWTHKRHPIPCPHGRAMGCLLWGFGRKLTA